LDFTFLLFAFETQEDTRQQMDDGTWREGPVIIIIFVNNNL